MLKSHLEWNLFNLDAIIKRLTLSDSAISSICILLGHVGESIEINRYDFFAYIATFSIGGTK